ncbi:sensor histidine kinase [Luedemannella helvata]|uniref:sensor histidine kinase n=1 Tax=Luedemannella helvata TaxID=349315 RepID=UPI0031DA7D68
MNPYRWWLIRAAAVVLASAPVLHPTVRSPWETAVLAAVGLAHVEVGVRMWRTRPDSAVGAVMSAAGLVWLLTTWDRADVPALGAGGLALSVCYDPMVLHCAMLMPAGRLLTRADRLIVAAAYLYWPTTIAGYWLLAGGGELTVAGLVALRGSTYPVAVAAGLLIVFVVRYARAGSRDRHAFAPLWTATFIRAGTTGVATSAAFAGQSWATAVFAAGAGLVPLGAAMSLTRSHRRDLIEAGDAARQRVERDVHDGVQQRLIAAALLLRQASRAGTPDRELVARGAAEVETAVAELRALVRGMNPPELVRYGLPGAVAALADRASVPITVDDRLGGVEIDEQAAVAAYFVVAEAVTNLERYAHASAATATLATAGGRLVVTVRDDGAGGAVTVPGGGLAGLRARVESCGGTFEVTSGPGTTVRASLPLGGAR